MKIHTKARRRADLTTLLLAMIACCSGCRSREAIVADCLASYRPVRWANISRNGDYGARYSWNASAPDRSHATFPLDARPR
jgi:hypothetical protein